MTAASWSGNSSHFSAAVWRRPVTKAQVTLMRSDNVVAGDSLALADLGIAPTALSTVLPEYRF